MSNMILTQIPAQPTSKFHINNNSVQWFSNFFMRDPNLSLMNISRPKPKTSKK